MESTCFRKVVVPFLLLLIPHIVYSQNSTVPQAGGTQVTKESSNSGVYTGRETYIPKPAEQKEVEPGATSFADGFLRRTRQHVGASVGLFESYTPDIVGSSSQKM